MIKKILVIFVLLMMISSIFILSENKINNNIYNYNPQTTTDYSFTITTSINPVLSGSNFYINASGLKLLIGSTGNILLYVNSIEVASYTYTSTTFSILYSLTTSESIYETASISTGRPPLITSYDGTSNTITENIVVPTNYSFAITTSINPIKAGDSFYINSTGLNTISGDIGTIHLFINNINVNNYSYTTSTFSILYLLNKSSSIYETAILTGSVHNKPIYYNGLSNVINENIIVPTKYNVEFIPNINGYYGLNLSGIQKGNLTLQYANGTYLYKANATGYINILSSFIVSGNSINVYLNFTKTEYNVLFIPNINTYYGLNISILTIQKGNLTLSMVNGTYSYKANATGYHNILGNFTVNGNNISVYLNFTSISIIVKYIIFKESGYKGNFIVMVNGNSYESNNGSIYIVQPTYYFNYSYNIIVPSGYNVNKSSGNVYNNSSIVYVNFNKVSFINYNIFYFVLFGITILLVYLIYKRLE